MKPNVYVINRSSHDFSDAERFGDLIFLSDGRIDKFATNNIYRMFQPILAASASEDYLLVTGLTIMVCIAAGMLASKHGRLNLLIHRADNTYVSRTLVFDDLEDQSMAQIIQEARS